MCTLFSVLRCATLVVLLVLNTKMMNSALAADPVAACVACHGAKGEGNPNLKAPRLAGLQAWYIEAQLTAFQKAWRGAVEGDVAGAQMRSAAAVLGTDADRKQVAAYFSQQKPVSAAVSSSAVEASGRNYYNGLCSACHGANGHGNDALKAPKLAGQDLIYLQKQYQQFKNKQRGAHPDDKAGKQMQRMAKVLPDEMTERAVLNYVVQLKP